MVSMKSKCPDVTLGMRGANLNLPILQMFKDTFLLGAVHMKFSFMQCKSKTACWDNLLQYTIINWLSKMLALEHYPSHLVIFLKCDNVLNSNLYLSCYLHCISEYFSGNPAWFMSISTALLLSHKKKSKQNIQSLKIVCQAIIGRPNWPCVFDHLIIIFISICLLRTQVLIEKVSKSCLMLNAGFSYLNCAVDISLWILNVKVKGAGHFGRYTSILHCRWNKKFLDNACIYN